MAVPRRARRPAPTTEQLAAAGRWSALLWRHRLSVQWPYLLVLGTVMCGLCVIGAHHFRIGTCIVAAGMMLAAVSRLVIRADVPSLLVVRRKIVDVCSSALLALALVVLALVTRGG